MPISPVSNVRFTSNIDLGRPGKFAAPTEAAPTKAPKSKKSVAKKIGTFAATLAVIAATLAGLTKFGVVKKLPTTEGAKFMEKIGHYLATAGEAIMKPFSKLFTKATV